MEGQCTPGEWRPEDNEHGWFVLFDDGSNRDTGFDEPCWDTLAEMCTSREDMEAIAYFRNNAKEARKEVLRLQGQVEALEERLESDANERDDYESMMIDEAYR